MFVFFQTASRIAAIVALALMVTACSKTATAPSTQQPQRASFVLHATFFSKESRQPIPIDPQVFVRMQGAKTGIGPQGIPHAAGYLPARLADPPTSPLYNADGKPLGFTLGRWMAAAGAVDITANASGDDSVAATLRGLIPRGVYSLFENHFDRTPVGFTPLDGRGVSNSFVASKAGTAVVTVTTRGLLTAANAVLLVYHSDAKSHGSSRGKIGITAHHQLIARIP